MRYRAQIDMNTINFENRQKLVMIPLKKFKKYSRKSVDDLCTVIALSVLTIRPKSRWKISCRTFPSQTIAMLLMLKLFQSVFGLVDIIKILFILLH